MSKRATASTVKGSTDPAKAIASVSYEDLYRRWWSPHLSEVSNENRS